jgi:hypothetical protein
MKKFIKWFNNKPEVVKQPEIKISANTLLPKGWYIQEAGQNPLHMLWFAAIVNFDDESRRYYTIEDCDSFEEAIRKCAEQIK